MSFNHLPPQAYSKETLIQAYNWLRHQPPQVQELAKTTDMLISLFTKAQMHGDAYLNRSHMQTFKSELKSLANMMGEFETQNLLNQQNSNAEKPATNTTPTNQNSNAGTNPGTGISAGGSTVGPLGTNFNINSNPPGGPSQNPASHFSSNFSQNSSSAGYNSPPTSFSFSGNSSFSSNSITNSQTPTNGNAASPMNSPLASNSLPSTLNSTIISALSNDESFLSPHIPALSQSLPAVINQLPTIEEYLKNQLDVKSWAMIQEVKNSCNLSSETEALRLIITFGYNKIKTQL